MRTLCRLVVLLLPLVAAAAPPPLDAVRVGDLANTDGRWQTGTVTVAAPAQTVQQWLADTRQWKARFPDIEWAQALGSDAQGRDVVRFRSRVIGRPITLHLQSRPGLITYDGKGKDIEVQGRIYVEAIDRGTTRVIMQTSGTIHGFAGAFASQNMKRQRAFRKLRADLTALTQLAHAYAAARRQRG